MHLNFIDDNLYILDKLLKIIYIYNNINMKKIIITLVLCLSLILCLSLFSCNDKSTEESISNKTLSDYNIVIIENHKYIIVTGWTVDSGVAIIHAESCECKNINK